MQSNRLGVVIVTHNPDANLHLRVRRWVTETSNVLIVDNGSNSLSRERISVISEDYGVSVVWNPKNMGIARALNQGLDWAQENRLCWIITADQDSTPKPNFVAAQMSLACSFTTRTVPLIGAVIDEEDGSSHSVENNGYNNAECEIVRAVITSGCLQDVNIVKSLGGYREDLFIDLVDLEICLRARRYGYSVVKNNQAHLIHQYGEMRKILILGKKFVVRDYAPVRTYYRFRNAIVVIRHYAIFEPGWCAHRVYRLIRLLGNIAVFYNDRVSHLAMAIRGLKDGLCTRLGKFEG